MENPRTKLDVIFHDLLGEVGEVLERQAQLQTGLTSVGARVADEVNAAAKRLEEAATNISVAAAASVQSAKASAGEFIVRRVNEETGRAVKEVRASLTEAAAAALGVALATHLANTQQGSNAQTKVPMWLAISACAATAILSALLTVFIIVAR